MASFGVASVLITAGAVSTFCGAHPLGAPRQSTYEHALVERHMGSSMALKEKGLSPCRRRRRRMDE